MTSFEKLKTKLVELFQLDQADLDFGIYRIMNARRDEINRFLDSDLLPQVREAFREFRSRDKIEIQKELGKVVEGVKAAGMDPEQSPRVRELRAKLSGEAVDIPGMENEVYDHLYNFFNRYYDEGDFISLRRYKEGVYAIPYEGEEVKLHWANHDQYYVKTTENFREYVFKTLDGHLVHLKIVEADTEKDNVKAANGNDRRFLLHSDKPVAEENGELVILFEYRQDTEKRRQDAINAETVRRVLADLSEEKLHPWKERLGNIWKRADGKVSDKTLLEKHLFDYTRRNTFDYFIHKDLGGFLRRELDFYIKSEVMRLDDVEEESAPRVEQYLSKIKVIRRIAHKIIDFLAQIENFQKKLWLKKKFVIETNYCITLDRVPEALYPKIAANDAQREEWVRLFAIDEIKGDMFSPAYSEPLTVEFLKVNSFLTIDTKFFSQDIKNQLLRGLDDMDAKQDGLLVHSENFQGLRLISSRYHHCIKSIYIDPPYNAAATEILYKNEYKHSSWCAFIIDRLFAAYEALEPSGIICVTIDDYELHLLKAIMDTVFGQNAHLATVPIRNNPSGRSTVTGFSINHEYALFYARDISNCTVGRLPHSDDQKQRYDFTDNNGKSFEWENFRKNSAASFRADRPRQFYPLYFNKSTKKVRIPKMTWMQKDKNWEIIEQPCGNELSVYPIDAQGRDRVWRFGMERTMEELANFKAEIKKDRIEIYKKKFINEVGSLPRTWWDKADYSARDNGTRMLNNLFGVHKDFDFPKAVNAVVDSLKVASLGIDDICLDFFAGSGTTGHAANEINRQDGGDRKYLLIEMGKHFDTTLKPRIQKIVYSKDWSDGKPISREGISHMFKYIRLESYEDALANIELQRTGPQQLLLDKADDFRESYMLKYMLDTESKGNQTLLNIDNFDDPWNYKLLVGTESVGETKPVNVDLVETFNWLLGLKVMRIEIDGDFQTIEGEAPDSNKILVIWRKIRDLDKRDPVKIASARGKANRDLEVFFKKRRYNTLDSKFDVVYVNGDNNLMNVPLDPDKEDPTPRYKVRLIEETFKELMFDLRDV